MVQIQYRSRYLEKGGTGEPDSNLVVLSKSLCKKILTTFLGNKKFCLVLLVGMLLGLKPLYEV